MDAALNLLMADTGGVRVSPHVPIAVSNKQNAIVRRGFNQDMVSPIWENIAILPDEITKAGVGEVILTGFMLHNVKILRTAGFYKQQVQSA